MKTMNIPKFARWVLNFLLGYVYLVVFIFIPSVVLGGVGAIFVGYYNEAAGGLGAIVGFCAWVVTLFHRSDFYITKK